MVLYAIEQQIDSETSSYIRGDNKAFPADDNEERPVKQARRRGRPAHPSSEGLVY